VNRDRIGTLRQRPAPIDYRRFPSIRKGVQGAFRRRLGELGDEWDVDRNDEKAVSDDQVVLVM
jgi:hypothetical protein